MAHLVLCLGSPAAKARICAGAWQGRWLPVKCCCRRVVKICRHGLFIFYWFKTISKAPIAAPASVVQTLRYGKRGAVNLLTRTRRQLLYILLSNKTGLCSRLRRDMVIAPKLGNPRSSNADATNLTGMHRLGHWCRRDSHTLYWP